MKSMEYIEWDKLEQIPFCLCRIAEDEENQDYQEQLTYAHFQ